MNYNIFKQEDQAQTSGSNAAASAPSHANQRTPDADYVEFGQRLARRIAPHLDASAIQNAVLSTLDELRGRVAGQAQEGDAAGAPDVLADAIADASGKPDTQGPNGTAHGASDAGHACKLVYVHSCKYVVVVVYLSFLPHVDC